jgi:hypothetical protein
MTLLPWVRPGSEPSAAVIEAAEGDRPGPPGALKHLSVHHSKSVLYGAFVWARRALNRPNRRFPARAVRTILEPLGYVGQYGVPKL